MFEIFIATGKCGAKHATVFIQSNLEPDDLSVFDDILSDLFAQNIYTISFDFLGCNYISSSLAGILVWAQTKAREKGGEITLLHVSEPILEVFDLLGISKTFNLAVAGDPDTGDDVALNQLMDSMRKLD